MNTIGLPEDRNLSFSFLEWIREPLSERNLSLANSNKNTYI